MRVRKAGWKCCKPRVLTFDEFLSIPPCTTGKHSNVDETPAPELTSASAPTTSDKKQLPHNPAPKPISSHSTAATATARITHPSQPQPSLGAQKPAPAPAPPDPDSDDPEDIDIPRGATCLRRGCNATYSPDNSRSDNEQCTHHPGQAIFHEGSKGWSCCKRRVLEFDEFMKIEGCKAKPRHRFSRKDKTAKGASGGSKEQENGAGGGGKEEEEMLESVRHDFYQTATSVIASLYLKKIDKERAVVEISERSVRLDLPTSGTDRKRYREEVPLFGAIDVEKSAFKVMGTKLELTLQKADGASWPVFRADERATGEIIQVGKPRW